MNIAHAVPASFSIPKKKPKVDVSLKADVEPESTATWEPSVRGSPSFRQIEDIVQKSQFERGIRLCLENVFILNNPYLKYRYDKYRTTLKKSGQPDFESIAFMQIGHHLEEREHFALNGVPTGMSFNDDIGDPQYGVYLYSHADLLSPQALFIAHRQAPHIVRVLICKVARGRTKQVGLGSRELEPISGFGCFVPEPAKLSHSYGPTRRNNAAKIDAFRQSAIYIYEIDENMDPVIVPSGVLPYAVVDLWPDKHAEKRVRIPRLEFSLQPLFTGPLHILGKDYLVNMTSVTEDAWKPYGIDPCLKFAAACPWSSCRDSTPFSDLLNDHFGQIVRKREIELKNVVVAYFLLSPRNCGIAFSHLAESLRMEQLMCVAYSSEGIRGFLIPPSEFSSRLGLPWPREPALHLIVMSVKSLFCKMAESMANTNTFYRDPTKAEIVEGINATLIDYTREEFTTLIASRSGHNTAWRINNPGRPIPRAADRNAPLDWDSLSSAAKAASPRPQRSPSLGDDAMDVDTEEEQTTADFSPVKEKDLRDSIPTVTGAASFAASKIDATSSSTHHFPPTPRAPVQPAVDPRLGLSVRFASPAAAAQDPRLTDPRLRDAAASNDAVAKSAKANKTPARPVVSDAQKESNKNFRNLFSMALGGGMTNAGEITLAPIDLPGMDEAKRASAPTSDSPMATTGSPRPPDSSQENVQNRQKKKPSELPLPNLSKKDEYDPANVVFSDEEEGKMEVAEMTEAELDSVPSPQSSETNAMEIDEDASLTAVGDAKTGLNKSPEDSDFDDLQLDIDDRESPRPSNLVEPSQQTAVALPTQKKTIDAQSHVSSLVFQTIFKKDATKQGEEAAPSAVRLEDFLSAFSSRPSVATTATRVEEKKYESPTALESPEEPCAPQSPHAEELPASPPQSEESSRRETTKFIPLDGDRNTTVEACKDEDLRQLSSVQPPRKSRLHEAPQIPIKPFGSGTDVDLRLAVAPTLTADAIRRLGNSSFLSNLSPEGRTMLRNMGKTPSENTKTQMNGSTKSLDKTEEMKYKQGILRTIAEGLHISVGVMHNTQVHRPLAELNNRQDTPASPPQNHDDSTPLSPPHSPPHAAVGDVSQPRTIPMDSGHTIEDARKALEGRARAGVSVNPTEIAMVIQGIVPATTVTPGARFPPTPGIPPYGAPPPMHQIQDPSRHIHPPTTWPQAKPPAYAFSMGHAQQQHPHMLPYAQQPPYVASTVEHTQQEPQQQERDHDQRESGLNRKLRRQMAKGNVAEAPAPVFGTHNHSKGDFDEREARSSGSVYRTVEESWGQAVQNKRRDDRAKEDDGNKKKESGELEDGEISDESEKGDHTREGSGNVDLIGASLDDVDDRIVAGGAFAPGPSQPPPWAGGALPFYHGAPDAVAFPGRFPPPIGGLMMHRGGFAPGVGRGGFPYAPGVPQAYGAHAFAPQHQRSTQPLVTIVVPDTMLLTTGATTLKPDVLEKILDRMFELNLYGQNRMIMNFHQHCRKQIRDKMVSLEGNSKLAAEFMAYDALLEKFEQRQVVRTLPLHNCDTNNRSVDSIVNCLRQTRQSQSTPVQIVYMSNASMGSGLGQRVTTAGFLIETPSEFSARVGIA